MKTQHDTGDSRNHAGDLDHHADEFDMRVDRCGSWYIGGHACSLHANNVTAMRLYVTLRTDQVDQDLLRLFSERLRAFVAHLGELFDRALLDLFVFGLEQFLPDFEEIDARVDFLDEFGGIFRQRAFAGGMLASCGVTVNFAWDARLFFTAIILA